MGKEAGREILNRNDIPVEVSNRLYSQLQSFKPRSKEYTKNISEDVEGVINSLPSDLRPLGRQIYLHLMDKEAIRLDRLGMVKVLNSVENLRLEDLLRALLIKKASVRTVRKALKNILPYIPNAFIRNNKVLELKNDFGAGKNLNGNISSADVFFDTSQEMKGGGVKFKTLDSFKWVHL